MADGQLCSYCGTPGSSKRCTLCREVIYCSSGCQQADWKGHKKSCSRKFVPPSPKSKPVQNPCVNCGKEGTVPMGGSWFCSHECCGGNLQDLTAQVKRLADEGEASKAKKTEDQRLMDWIKGTIEEPSKVTAPTPAPKSKGPVPVPKKKPEVASDAATLAEARRLLENQEADDATTLAKLRELLGVGKEVPAPRTQEGAAAGAKSTADKVMELVAAGEKAQVPAPSAQQGGAAGARSTADKVMELVAAGEKALVVKPQPGLAKDNQSTVDKVMELVMAGEKAAAACEPPGHDRIRSLVAAGEQGAEATAEEVKRTAKMTAQETQRVADFIQGVCAQSPEEALKQAREEQSIWIEGPNEMD